MQTYTVKFKRGSEMTSITLYSHFTCIIGKYSGEGKSEFIAALLQEVQMGNDVFESELPVVIADAASLSGVLGNPNRQIIIIDELAMLRGKLLAEINRSKHLFIGISRGNPLRLEYPLGGIYSITRTANWFKIESRSGDLPVMSKCSDCKTVMESEAGRSEHELLADYFEECIPVSGRNNIEKKLRGSNEAVQVFADLGAIGSAFSILKKRCQDNPDIRFYNYDAFEQLLVESPLLKGIEVADNFDYLSLERYYEAWLEDALARRGVEFKHGEKLPDLVKEADVQELFDSEVGRPLLRYLRGEGEESHIFG